MKAEATTNFFGRLHRSRIAGPFSLAHWTANRPPPLGTHYHAEAHFLFIVAGQYESTAGENGRLFFYPAATEHADHLRDGRGSFVSISVAPNWLNGVENERASTSPRVLNSTRTAISAQRLVRELVGSDAPLVLEDCCTTLFASFLADEPKLERANPGWLRRAKELLSDTLAQPCSVNVVSRSVGVHPVHLTRTFRHVYGCTPGEYSRSLRLKVAADMVSRGESSISQIAAACGFSDQSHLTNQFRRAYGITPAELRASTRS